MENLTITIKPPITEYCKKCDYEASYSFSSYHYKCPKCGEQSINHGARPNEEKAVRVSASQGSFNWANPSEKQWQYSFYNVPSEKTAYNFVVDEELDTSDCFELAQELKEIIDRYWINSDKEKIDELVKIMDTEEFADRQYMLETRDKKERLERELFKLNEQTRCYELIK